MMWVKVYEMVVIVTSLSY